MQSSLRHRQRLERRERAAPHAIGKSGFFDHGGDVAVGADDRCLLGLDVDLGASEPGTEDGLCVERPSADGDALAQRADLVEIGAEVDERAEGHVAGDAGEAVEPGDDRHLSNRITALAAPKPLSMPTTVMPAAHDASMARSAVTPSRAAP